MLHHDACTNQLRECSVLFSPVQNLQHALDHNLQGRKGILMQVLLNLYPEKNVQVTYNQVCQGKSGSEGLI